MLARLEGKSSLGRMGLTIHSTAGLIDPGFNGNITMEIRNNVSKPFILYPYMPIAQLTFDMLTTPAERPYGTPGLGSRYQYQRMPVGSRSHEEGCA